MQFHDCGARLITKVVEGKSGLYCPKCNVAVASDTQLPRVVQRDASTMKQESIMTIDKNDTREQAPIEHTCAKCGFGKAYLITQPPIWGDEDDTILYRCAKCGYSARDQMKVM